LELPLAGFQVIMYGRFWVITEVIVRAGFAPEWGQRSRRPCGSIIVLVFGIGWKKFFHEPKSVIDSKLRRLQCSCPASLGQ